MNILEEVMKSKRKPKELVIFLAERVKSDKRLFGQLVEGLRNGSDVQKGICSEVMEYVTKDHPEFAAPYLDGIIAYINYDAPKVKWETARVVANASQKFPERVAKAVPKLLLNAKDSGTVVRWSAAYALTEIAKHDPKLSMDLVPRFLKIVRKEDNSGVKNVYLKALKQLTKE